MRRLYLLRHGTADPRPPDGSDSPERALIPKGRSQVERAAEMLLRMDVAPARVVSSPYVRARQTAEHLLVSMELEREIELAEGLAATATRAEALAVVRGLYQQMQGEGCALLAGHEPLLSELGATLCGAPDALIDLKKGGVIELSMTGPRSAYLLGVIRPKHLPRAPARGEA